MSYPEPRYFGETGDVSATYRPVDHPPELTYPDGRKWIDTRLGDFVHVPEGGIHGFRNESGEPAAMLIHFAPGAPREGYFEGLAEFARSGRQDPETLAAFYRLHDNIWLRNT